MTVEFDSRGYLAGLHQVLAEDKLTVEADYRRMAERTADAGRAFVHVKSGQTKGAITVEEGVDGQGHRYWDIGTDGSLVDPAKALSEEFGSFDQEPRPFMRPAFAQEVR